MVQWLPQECITSTSSEIKEPYSSRPTTRSSDLSRPTFSWTESKWRGALTILNKCISRMMVRLKKPSLWRIDQCSVTTAKTRKTSWRRLSNQTGPSARSHVLWRKELSLRMSVIGSRSWSLNTTCESSTSSSTTPAQVRTQLSGSTIKLHSLKRP